LTHGEIEFDRMAFDFAGGRFEFAVTRFIFA
jgi:hypothetical protein